MKIRKYTFQFLLTLLIFTGCKEIYNPPALKTNLGYLVVDGFLNNSSDSTFIRLSRTRRLDSNLINSGENNAQITIEDNTGTTLYYLQQFNNDGGYALPGMSLNISDKYKLRIKTANGKEYVSDEVTVTQTPPIDSISWQKDQKGVTIFANTHGSVGNTRYYRWEYTETYEYHAPFFSTLKFENGAVAGRSAAEEIYACWRTNDSKNLLLASTTKLSEDIIYQYPLRFIEMNGIELDVKYSMLLRQFSLTEPAYEYLQNLKRVSEQIGTLFDAQPSQLTGNIHCVNSADEPVLGYITACNIDSKRIYITDDQVAPWPFGYSCSRIQVDNTPESLAAYIGSAYVPLYFVSVLNSTELYIAPRECADCTIYGGVTVKPSFWP